MYYLTSKVSLLLLLYICSVYAARNFDVLWTRCNCSIGNLQYISAFDCHIVELSKKRGNYINANLRFRQDIHQMAIDFRVILPRADSNLELLKFRADGCRLFFYQAKNRILHAVVNKLLQSSNFPKYCPLRSNETYNIAHFSLNPDNFPLYSPEFNFTTQIELITRRNISMVTASLDAMLSDKKSKFHKYRASG